MEWLCEIGEDVQMTSEGIHKATTFFEQMLSKKQLKEKEWQEVAMICLYLSAKLIESDKIVYNIKKMLKTKFEIRSSQLMSKEAQIFSKLGWNLQSVTPLDFLLLFESQGLIFNIEKVKTDHGERPVNIKISQLVKHYSEFFVELCLQRYTPMNFTPLQIACGCLALARKETKITQVWTEELEQMTGMNFSDIEECLRELEEYYGMTFKKIEKQTEDKTTRRYNRSIKGPKVNRSNSIAQPS